MGTRNSKPIVAPKEVQQKISSKSKEHENIKLHFQQLSKSYDQATGRIPKDVFIANYLKHRLPSFGNELLERFFIVLSFHGKDHIVFDEFLQTKYLMEHIPPEAQTQIAKSADDFYTEEDIIREHRLSLIFNLFDLDFNGYISLKEYTKVLPSMMQDESARHLEEEEMAPYGEWFEEIAEFAMTQFERSAAKMQRLSFRDFRTLARHDLTVQRIMRSITPHKEEFECFKYALAIQRKQEKKRSKKDRKKHKAQRTPKKEEHKEQQ